MINIWISACPDHIYSDLGHRYPYSAQSPLTGAMITFNNVDEVYRYFEAVYDDSMRRAPKRLGESIYLQGAFFYDLMLLLDQNYQDRIKEFSFCKTFNCSPFKSLQETPEAVVDDFIKIESEFKSIQEYNQRKSDGNK